MRLCKDFGISAYIINSVMDKNQVSVNTEEEDSKSKERGQVSSTRVRHVTEVRCSEAGLEFPKCCKVNFSGSLTEPDVLL